MGPVDRSRAHSDRIFGNRFDDPTGYCRIPMLWVVKLILILVDAVSASHTGTDSQHDYRACALTAASVVTSVQELEA